MHQTPDTHKQRGRNQLCWQLGYVCLSPVQLSMFLHRCGTHGVHLLLCMVFCLFRWLSNVARRMKGKYSGLVWARFRHAPAQLLPHLLQIVPGNSSQNHLFELACARGLSMEQLCSHQSHDLDFGVCVGAPRLKTPGSTSTERDVL